ncbi:MAG: hypothetical protein ACLFP8_04480 [Alphaproteobacteria bacterium]
MVKISSRSTTAFLTTLLIALVALFLSISFSAQAGTDETQEPKAPTHTTATQTKLGTPVDILANFIYAVTFLHNPSVSESDFLMRISHIGDVAGCIHLQGKTYPGAHGKRVAKPGSKISSADIEYVGHNLFIELTMPTIAMSDGQPRYTNYDCEVSHATSYVDIPLNRDELIEKNIKKLMFKTTRMDLGQYEIDINKDRLIFKGIGGQTLGKVWQTLWFFPRNTVKLYAPGATSRDVTRQIYNFGKKHALTPMNEVLDGYRLPLEIKNHLYFIDTQEIYTKGLSTKTKEDNIKKVGNIKDYKSYDGPEGRKTFITPLPLYATLVEERIVTE